MKRVLDLLLSLVALCMLCIPILIICMLVRLTSKGPVFYWSDRVGKFNVVFKMPKFRSMKLETPNVATHLLENSNKWMTPIGSILRKSSLDEIPQLWSIFKGDMSFVGPRPALFNQKDLIELRTENGVHFLLPGLTGWAQVNGRDDLSTHEKVQLDIEYLHKRSFLLDLKILVMTVKIVVNKTGVSH